MSDQEYLADMVHGPRDQMLIRTLELEQRKRIGGNIRENEGGIRSLTNLQEEYLRPK